MTRALIGVVCVLLWSAPAMAQATNRSVTIADVIQLVQAGISDETIITFLDTRDIAFDPSAETIVYLRAAGVSEEVIRYLLQRTAAVSAPAYPPPFQYSPGYSVVGYPLPYYSPRYYGGSIVVTTGFPILPHGLHHHHISHVTLGHLFAARRVHVGAGHIHPHHGSALGFGVPLRATGHAHGIRRVGLSRLSARRVTHGSPGHGHGHFTGHRRSHTSGHGGGHRRH